MQIDEINESEELKPTPTEAEESTPTLSSPATPSTAEATVWGRNQLDLSPIHSASERIKHELGKIIIGQKEFIDLLLSALFAGGHVMVEGVPGIAKTLTAKLMAQTLEVDFSRIQFTPDLMPSDVIGTTVFNMQTSAFSFNQGPIFANFVLIDEINRAPAKTQAALFEVMEEHQVTVDGQTYQLSFPFFVLATQNPIEQEGTYKLPEAQLDRFIIKINLEYPSLQEEEAILQRFRNDFGVNSEHVDKVFSAKELKACQELVEKIHIKDELLQYIAQITHNTRNNGDLFLGASPRASLAMLRMAKATAALAARDFVTPDDIQQVAYPVLNHRIILTPEREMEGFTTKEVIQDIIEKIEVPR